MFGIEEALTALGAAPLVQKRISPLVNELQRRYSPLLEALPSEPWNSTIFNWDARTALPAGGSTTDGGTRPVTNSTYIQTPITIQHVLGVGSVTGFAEAVTQSYGSLRGREINGMIKGVNWDVETLLDWGQAAATAGGPYPEFDGLDVLCSQVNGTNSQPQNTFDIAGGAFHLGQLDQIINLVENNVAEGIFSDDWMFVASPAVETVIAQKLLAQQRYSNLPKATIGAGLVVMTYRDIPIVKSSWLNQAGGNMSTLTGAQASTGGSITASTNRWYVITAILPRQGESGPSNELHVTVSAGTNTNVVTISFTPPAATGSSPVLAYKVYESATTGTETLLGVADGVVGLAGDNVTPILTTSIVDTGTILVPQNGSTAPAWVGNSNIASAVSYVGGGLGQLTPPVANGQDIYLMSRDPANVTRPYVRDCQPINGLAPTVLSPDQLPYALISDTALAVRMNTFMARLHNVLVSISATND